VRFLYEKDDMEALS